MPTKKTVQKPKQPKKKKTTKKKTTFTKNLASALRGGSRLKSLMKGK